MIRIVANTSALKFQSVSLRQYIVPRARRFCTGESRSIVFQRAVQALQQPADPKNKKDVGNDIKLKLYAFYKQAETGTCVGSRPGMFDLVGRAKFDAWKELGNMSKDDAMEAYIKEVTKIFDGKLPAVTLNKSTITEAKQTFATTEKVVETTFKLRSLAEIAFPHKSQNSSNSLKLTTVNVSCDEKGIVKLFLDRPDKGNAFNMILLEELTVAWKWIKQHPQTRVVIVTSDHAHFSTGMDLSVFVHLQTVLSQESCDARKREGLIRFIDYLQQIVTEAETCGVPVISAIAGHCIGGAIDLICATDLRYCTDSTAFSVKEIDLAIVADMGTLQRLPRIVGKQQTAELTYTGRTFHGKEAESMGLVLKSFATKEELMKHVQSTAEQIASKSPITVRGIKRSMNFNENHTIEDSLEHIQLYNASMVISEDLAEAATAIMSKSTPQFKRN